MAAQVVAAEATGSSKPPRRDPATRALAPPPNEDRAVAVEASGLFGVFDGHGGFGAAEFVSAFLPPNVHRKLGEARAAAAEGEGDAAVVPAVLEAAFIAADQALYATVRSQLPRGSPRVSASSPRCSTCRWYRERPCACTGVALPANEGSTGSLLHVRTPLLQTHPHRRRRLPFARACSLSGVSAVLAAAAGDGGIHLLREHRRQRGAPHQRGGAGRAGRTGRGRAARGAGSQPLRPVDRAHG